MSLYSDLAEDQLVTEIATIKARIRAVGTGDTAGVKSIAGEGRRVEFFGSGGGADLNGLRGLLREAEAALALLRGESGSAIGVGF